MKATKHHTNIYQIDNFLSSAEISTILDCAISTPEAVWWDLTKNPQLVNNYWLGKYLRCNIPDEINTRLYSLFESLDFINPIKGVQRLQIGQSMDPHLDTVETNIEYGLVIYLNDDFEGGFTAYPNLDMYIKPKAGTLIIHKADELHGATAVLGGNSRYILSAFVRGSDDSPARLRQDLCDCY